MPDGWLIYHEEPITLHSGGKSHWFVDGQRIFDDPHLRESVLACWERAVRHWADTFPRGEHPYFVGIPRGGLCWAKAIAARLDAEWGPIQDAPKGNFVYAVDDICTTGASLRSVPSNWNLVVVARCSLFRGSHLGLTAWAWIDLECEEAAHE